MAASPANIRRIDFNKIHDRAGPNLATYINGLVTATPSELDRLEVATTGTPVFVAPHRRTPLAPRDRTTGNPTTPLRLHEILKINSDSPGLDSIGEGNSRILGFSSDGAWILIFSAQGIGSKCIHQELKFINQQHWQEMSLPLWTEDDFDSGEEWPLADELTRRLDRAQHYVDKLAIAPGVELYREFQPLNHGAQPPLTLEFGRISFTINIAHAKGRRALVLRAATFLPARKAAVVIERMEPGRFFRWSGSEEPDFLIQPKGFQSICEATLSPQGSLVAFGVLTNSEHDCWGNTDVHHVFLTVEELKELCIEAMRS